VVKTPFKQMFVGDDHINTIILGQGPPLVLLHGFGGGIGLWIGNLDSFTPFFTIYACDILGFGRSSRPEYDGNTGDDAESWFLDFIECWRQELGLDRFFILGHSFGAYLSGLYSLKYPQNIIKLILVDPWGVPEKPLDWDTRDMSFKHKIYFKLFKYVHSPFSIVRAAGPLGHTILSKFRDDLSEKFIDFFPEDNGTCIIDYVYYSNMQTPSGEKAFKSLSLPIAWAKNPLINRLGNLDENIPCYFIFGQYTWMSTSAGETLSRTMKGKSEVAYIENAGHHVYIDNYKDFNETALSFLFHNEIENFIIDNNSEDEIEPLDVSSN